MNRCSLSFVATLLLVSSAGAVAQSAEAPAGATGCSGCHAASAQVETPVPRLVGRDQGEIAGAMRAFRSGLRQGTVMNRIAKGFSDDEIAAIAAWYGAQK